MSDAVYGLVGALSGSLMTAAVAYWGPLHQQREVARQAELQRIAEMRRAEMEIEAARAQADEARRHVRYPQEIARLVEVRSALRAWQLALDDASADMQLMGALDLGRFREKEQEVMAKALRALDEVMHDHWYVPVSYYGEEPTREDELLVETLKMWGARIRTLGLSGRPLSVEEKEELDELRAQASRQRRRISDFIEKRLESIFIRHEPPRS